MGDLFAGNLLKSDASEIVRLYNSLYGQGSASKSANDIAAFSKALAACAVPEGYMLVDIYKDVQKNIKSIQDLQYIYTRVLKKNPEYMVCIPLMLTGLSEFIASNVSDITKEIKTFYKGAAGILPTMVKGIVKALSNETIDSITKQALDDIIDGLMVMGGGYLLSLENKGVDFVENKAMQSMALIGQMMAIYMTLFVEFRWAMMMIFVKNVKDQVDDRVKKIEEVRKALANLHYEDFISKARETSDQRQQYLNLYIAALKKLENTIPLARNIERTLYKKSSFDQFSNSRIKENLTTAKDYLIKQRNTFLEKFYNQRISDEANTEKAWKFYLANDYTNVASAENVPEKPVFWVNEPSGENISLNKVFVSIKILTDANIIIYPASAEKIASLSLRRAIDSNFWVLQKTDFSLKEGDFLLIDKKFYKIKAIQIELGNPANDTKKVIALLLEPMASGGLQISGEKSAEVYREMDKSFFQLTKDWKIFQFQTDGSYTITKLEDSSPKIAPPFSIDINEQGIAFVKEIWGDTKKYSFYPFFIVNTVEKSFKILNDYPNMVEKEANRRESATANLPEPFKSMYEQYSNLKNEPINKFSGNDLLNTGSTISTFLFGKDILKDNIYKLKRDVLSYDKYLETASNLLEQLCPLRNNYIYFYSLLETLKNLDTDFDITNTATLRELVFAFNREILLILTSMTYRNPETSEFATIESIKKSPYLSALVPSALLDIDNIEMMQSFATMNNQFGTGLNKNRELQKMYAKFMNFVKWLRDMKVIESLEAAEDKVWNTIYNSLLSTINMMLRGNKVSTIRLVMKNSIRTLYMLMIRLNQLSQNLNYFINEGDRYTSISSNPAMKDFMKFLNDNGLGHFLTYIKDGKWINFVNGNINEWVGKYSSLINCLLKYKKEFGLGGADKLYLDKIISLLNKLSQGDILTRYELGVSGIIKSINLNFIGKLPIGMKTDLANKLKTLELSNNVKNKVIEKLSQIK